MDPKEALNLLYGVVRQLTLSADDHEKLKMARDSLNSFIEKPQSYKENREEI